MSDVKVYSTATCPYCVRVKQYLKEKAIKFEEINISEDPQKMQEMVEKSGQMGVPTLDIDGRIIVGFDKDKIEQALGLSGE
ncbi:MAG: glutaredoxin family protein [Candidatus Omnitrophota bacterium]